MGRAVRQFTVKQVEALSEAGRYCDGNRLWIQVRDRDHKSWLYRFVSPVTGKPRSLGLGDYFNVSLAEARRKAEKAAAQIRDGKDPVEEKIAARREKKAAFALAAGTTFRQAAEKYIAVHSSTWKNEKHRAQWPSTLQAYAYPTIGEKPVQSIDTSLIVKILEPIWHAKPETASRLRGRIETVLDFATTHGWRSGENPARWRGHLENVLPARAKVAPIEHHPALPWKEMPAFMQGALAAEEGTAAMALKFAILTAARTGEVIGATWKEVDMAAKLWTIPASRMKAGREHKVPLSGAAMDVLRQAAEMQPEMRPDAPIFAGRRDGQPLSNMALLMLLRRLGRGDLTAHGFRSSFRDWTAENTNYPRDVAEMALAHTIGDKVEAAYRRGDLMEKRTALMADWAAFLSAKPAA